MSRFEVHKVDGTTHFVPVQILSTYNNGCHIEINTPSGPRDLIVDMVHSFPKSQKVVVPQFVADHIEYLRGINSPMRDLFSIAWIDSNELALWLYNEPGADDMLARAWLNGYEVERERRFIVEIPDPEKPNGKKTNLAKLKGKVFLSSTASAAPLTEAEIKRNHAWAWTFAREVLE